MTSTLRVLPSTRNPRSPETESRPAGAEAQVLLRDLAFVLRLTARVKAGLTCPAAARR